MSYLFPDHIISILEGDGFTVIKVPHQKKYDKARSENFTSFYTKKCVDPEFKKDKFCLWHAKHGERLSILSEKNWQKEYPNQLIALFLVWEQVRHLKEYRYQYRIPSKKTNCLYPKFLSRNMNYLRFLQK